MGLKDEEPDRHRAVWLFKQRMIAAEKLRALCQQMEAYPQRKRRAPRARDFYDITAIVTEASIDFASADFHTLVIQMFAAKEVPLSLLQKIPETRDFHLGDWPAVRDSILDRHQDFDYYFNFVSKEVKKLQPLWKE